MARPFTVGEKVIVVDAKGRQYLVTLVEGGEFHTHAGVVAHAELVGREEGTTVRSSAGARYTAMRPTITDFVFRMPRGAQVIYPKDLGPILIMADIHPGVRVVEAGVGSGALSMTMVRAGADVVGYELREDFAARARENVAAFVGVDVAAERYRVDVRDVYGGIDERDLDAVVLDLPEPWLVVPHAESALRGGGTLLAYNPSITQAVQLREALVDSSFELAETVEILRRTWHVEGQAVRPDHRMVAHTGFLTSARLLGPVPGGLKAPRTAHVNLFDVAIIVVTLSAAIGGFRLGLLARALSWAGMLLGLIVAARALPTIIGRFPGADPSGRLLVAAGVLLGGAFVGQGVGLVVGARAHLALPLAGRPVDRVGGAAAGVVGVMVAVWLLVPTMADVPGTASRLARGSAIARAIDERTPLPPDALQALRRLVGENRFPQVFSTLRPAPDVGPPPADAGIPPDVVALVAASTVRIEGRACDRIQEGTGFVAGSGVVVTNAHVVAGADDTEVIRPDGSRAAADVVVFDPQRDLAVLSVPTVGAPPLPIGDVEVGGVGGVFGHPGGGPLEISPFAVREEVEAVGRDLYDERDTRRQVLVLASELAPGDSGGATVDREGNVVGVAFAIAPDRPGTAYALTTDELAAALTAERRSGTDTGPCLS